MEWFTSDMASCHLCSKNLGRRSAFFMTTHQFTTLVVLTEFRKLPDDDPTKLPTLKPLLKAYQTQIDFLTQQSKSSSSAFLTLYKLLAEAPDPYPLLDAAVDMTVKVAEARMLESEVGRLRDENNELRGKVAELGGVEEKRKKAEGRVTNLEEKVSLQTFFGAYGIPINGLPLVRKLLDSQSDFLLYLLPQMEDLIRDKVSQKENELNAQFDERMRNYQER